MIWDSKKEDYKIRTILIQIKSFEIPGPGSRIHSQRGGVMTAAVNNFKLEMSQVYWLHFKQENLHPITVMM